MSVNLSTEAGAAEGKNTGKSRKMSIDTNMSMRGSMNRPMKIRPPDLQNSSGHTRPSTGAHSVRLMQAAKRHAILSIEQLDVQIS